MVHFFPRQNPPAEKKGVAGPLADFFQMGDFRWIYEEGEIQAQNVRKLARLFPSVMRYFFAPIFVYKLGKK